MRGAALDDDAAAAAAFGVALFVFFFALPCVLTAFGLLMVAAEPMGRTPAPLPDDMARVGEREGCEWREVLNAETDESEESENNAPAQTVGKN